MPVIESSAILTLADNICKRHLSLSDLGASCREILMAYNPSDVFFGDCCIGDADISDTSNFLLWIPLEGEAGSEAALSASGKEQGIFANVRDLARKNIPSRYDGGGVAAHWVTRDTDSPISLTHTIIYCEHKPGYQKARDELISIKFLTFRQTRYAEWARFLDVGNWRRYDEVVSQAELETVNVPGDCVAGFLFFKSHLEKWRKYLSFIGDKAFANVWHAAHQDAKSPIPWEWTATGEEIPGSNVGTVTLSLDLRKSTFMMRQADDRSQYAHWLEALVDIARHYCHENEGIFDKFTGDGAILHFHYYSDCEDNIGSGDKEPSWESRNRRQAVIAAFECARQLMIAVAAHVRMVADRLDFTSGKSGVAIGLAYGPAAWSLDRDGRPVVVGTGVVNACRISNGEHGTIRSTINLSRIIEGEFAEVRFQRIRLKGIKDFSTDEDPMCGELRQVHHKHSAGKAEIESKAQQLWENVIARHPRPCG